MPWIDLTALWRGDDDTPEPVRGTTAALPPADDADEADEPHCIDCGKLMARGRGRRCQPCWYAYYRAQRRAVRS